ncbi:MAG: tRNA (adenosine(37)-N6)-dimethylallyltransferase MiaA [Candidatus Omnitrophica bacterium]|nr:tRNA (adenosine(37)-N6)-dimethylallyltransferase MiaA [Candidatus Omnitrophota bacterium]
MNLPIIFIVGPTGVGKSAVAMALAAQMNAEIISCDAMQVYREAAIANDKPAIVDLKCVPHHMIGCVGVKEEYDVARYRKDAITAIEDVHGRGGVPLVVGGSGMYVSILLDGIFEGNAQDPMVRRQLTEDAKVLGSEKLYQRLKKVDPVSAAKINPNDERRIIRALEVYVSNRKPISQMQKDRSGLWGKYPIKVFALNRERQELYDRVDQRVEKMFAAGLVEEIKQLTQLELSKTAGVLIGIPEITAYLRDEISLQDAKEEIQLKTRHYVKRQLTWFRKDKRLEWLMIAQDDTALQTAQRILEKLKESNMDITDAFERTKK